MFPTTISLLLHDVTDEPDKSGFLQPTARRYKHSVGTFQQYLDVIEATGLPVRTGDGLHSDTTNLSVVLTFDDGGASAPIAAALLEERGWRGMFFITTDLIGKPGFVTAEQIRELHRRGHIIGSHSCSHPDVFRRLTRQEMRREWSESRDALQQLLGTEITTASVPGGDIDTSTLEEAAAAGYRQIFTSEQVTQPWSIGEAVCFGRLMMLDNTSPRSLNRWLRHPSVGVLPERLVRFTKSSVKKLIGPLYLRLVERRRALHEPR